jgi:hypothetical protein
MVLVVLPSRSQGRSGYSAGWEGLKPGDDGGGDAPRPRARFWRVESRAAAAQGEF